MTAEEGRVGPQVAFVRITRGSVLQMGVSGWGRLTYGWRIRKRGSARPIRMDSGARRSSAKAFRSALVVVEQFGLCAADECGAACFGEARDSQEGSGVPCAECECAEDDRRNERFELSADGARSGIVEG
jgi:hypothetical protein